MLVHRPRPAGPEPCLNAVAPSRTERVVCVDGLCTWSWLADPWARAAMPCVLGPALARQALQGGNAQNDPSAAQNMAVGLRGGRLPPASGYPAAMRATRERLRRRRPQRRQRAARLAPLQPPNRPYPLPEMGKPSADQAHRAGVAERWPAPAVQKSIEVALARLGPDDQLRRAVARSSGNPATPPNAPPLSLLRPVPGMGALLRVGLLSAIPGPMSAPPAASARGPRHRPARGRAPQARRAGLPPSRGPAPQRPCCASGPTLRASKSAPTWRTHPARAPPAPAAPIRGLVPCTPCGTGQRRAIGRRCGQESGAARLRPTSPWTTLGCAAGGCAVLTQGLRRARRGAHRPLTLSPSLCLDLRSGSARDGDSRGGWTCAAPPPRLALTGARWPFRLLFAADGTRGPSGCSVVAPTPRGRGTRRCRGERPSSSVWCRDVGAPASGNADGTRGQGRAALG